MADLVVDYGLLDQVGRSLTGLIGEFGHIQAQERAYFSDWGSPAIASAMDGFAGNWSYHRAKLISSMEALRAAVTESQAGFSRTDTALARHVTPRP